MDFSNILQYLQGLITNKQGMQTTQYNSNLGLQNQELGQQNTQFNSSLAEKQAEFQRQADLQKQLQDQQNALAQSNLALKTGAQNFDQKQQALQTSPGFMQLMAMLNPNPTSVAATQKLLADKDNRINAAIPWYLRPGASSSGLMTQSNDSRLY